MYSPNDIQEFWEGTRAVLDKIPIEPELSPAPEQSAREFDTYNVTLTSFGGIKLRGWYSVPKDNPRGKCSAILAVPGYSGSKQIPTHIVLQGYAVLTLFPRSQGESKAEWQIESGTYLTYHITDRDQYYYRGAYMDCVRGIDFLASRAEVDADRIGMWSRSQGGGLTLATSSLDGRVKAGVAEEPFLCNYPLAIEVKTNPYVELGEYLSQHPDQKERALETLAYFDPLNLVEMITRPMLVNIGMKDDVCPYHTIVPVFERIVSHKALMIYPNLGHSSSADFNNHAKNWLDLYL